MCIPRNFWTLAVSLAASQECSNFEVFLFVLLSLITTEIMKLLKLEHRPEKNEMLRRLSRHPTLIQNLQTAITGHYEMIQFMHSPEQKRCECLSYVATAAEIGTLRARDQKLSAITICAVCEQALANPKVCARCQEVAYCGIDHQKKDWKEHKKACKDGRELNGQRCENFFKK
mmetsp:Transcript_3952/g.9790  ORF Transcript_3952/g.9790 Transcript_3952/m.9790 type:complete len:173 (-) Transcript_3952:100-618(-)